METIKGYVEHIVYRNEDNGYTVFNLNNDDGELTCVGKFHFIEEGELLELTGEYTMHKLYGTCLLYTSSALDNRPLSFDEFEQKIDQVLFVSATPGPYEAEHELLRAEQVIRPTGPVSYTHLDVYKRQGHGRQTAKKKKR